MFTSNQKKKENWKTVQFGEVENFTKKKRPV